MSGWDLFARTVLALLGLAGAAGWGGLAVRHARDRELGAAIVALFLAGIGLMFLVVAATA